MSGITYQTIRCSARPDRGYVAEYIYRRVTNYNKNFLGVVLGETGGGKSYTALRICEDVDPEFSVDSVHFSTTDFVNHLKRLQELASMGVDISGRAVMFDEIQVSQSNRAWMSKTNKLMNFVLSTFRNMNLIVIFTTPNLNMLDSQSRMLLHGIFQAVSGGGKRSDYRTFTFKVVESNPITGDIYYKNLRVHEVWNHRVVTVGKIKVYKPSKKLSDDYEAKKRAFTERLNESVARELGESAKPKQKDVSSF